MFGFLVFIFGILGVVFWRRSIETAQIGYAGAGQNIGQPPMGQATAQQTAGRPSKTPVIRHNKP
jgi:hypothetical protein